MSEAQTVDVVDDDDIDTTTPECDLPAIVRGYLRTAAWDARREGDNSEQLPYVPRSGPADDAITDEHLMATFTYDQIMSVVTDCLQFMSMLELLTPVVDDPRWTAAVNVLGAMEPGTIGHLFYLNRNHLGAGFWSEGLGKGGDYLSTIASAFGETTMEIEYEGVWYVA